MRTSGCPLIDYVMTIKGNSRWAGCGGRPARRHRTGKVYRSANAAIEAIGEHYRLGVCPDRCSYDQKHFTPTAYIWTPKGDPRKRLTCPLCGRVLERTSRWTWDSDVTRLI